MIIQIEVPDYEKHGLTIIWEDDAILTTKFDNEDNLITISANEGGLISLARHMLSLAQPNVPIGHHVHYENVNPSESNSYEMVLEKI